MEQVTKRDVERRLLRRGWIRLGGEFVKGRWGVLIYDLGGPVAYLGKGALDDALAVITPGAIEYPYGPEEDVKALAESIQRAMA